MKKRTTLLAATFCFFAVSISSAVFAQGAKIGIVDMEVIVKQLPEAKEADAKLTELSKKYRDTMELMQKEYTDKAEKYDKAQAMMSPEAKAKEEETLKSMIQRFRAYQEDKFGNTGVLSHNREDLLLPIRQKVDASIKIVAKKEGLSLVLSKTESLVLYSDEKLDITFSVLDLIKRGGADKPEDGKKKK